ncbi:unnamed protein product [Litomosoides sigmodontis]|uniref:Uncharacterized protein n=1 Tax=Litomosoides sigmodontis TaxID=42156 RepID=A0A3P6TCQ3_LITSI|nr:unnamed protein product [Litomosoides sigmodontis]
MLLSNVAAATEISKVQACAVAKHLAGVIRTLKEQIVTEMNIWQETNAENCQLKIDIHHFQQRLKELDVLCINCETSNAEIERRKKRYSEQLTKISKLISEQNFDAANWAIILDEMAFVNRELFDILTATAAVERKALQLEIVEEEKYRTVAEKFVLKRIELRQALYSQMKSYESLRAQISETEIRMSDLQKAVDFYDAECWQLNDTKHHLQFQIFQLQELLRYSEHHKPSFPINENGKKSASSDVSSDFAWKKERSDSTRNCAIPSSSPISFNASYFLAERHNSPFDHKLRAEQATKKQMDESDWSTSMESFKTTPPEMVIDETETKKQIDHSAPMKLIATATTSPTSARNVKLHESFIKSNLNEKRSEAANETAIDEIDTDQESTTDLRSSDEENSISASKLNSSWISDDEKTDLTSESISLPEIPSEKSDKICAIKNNVKVEGLSPQNETIEFWEEISETTFFRGIANQCYVRRC